MGCTDSQPSPTHAAANNPDSFTKRKRKRSKSKSRTSTTQNISSRMNISQPRSNISSNLRGHSTSERNEIKRTELPKEERRPKKSYIHHRPKVQGDERVKDKQLDKYKVERDKLEVEALSKGSRDSQGSNHLRSSQVSTPVQYQIIVNQVDSSESQSCESSSQSEVEQIPYKFTPAPLEVVYEETELSNSASTANMLNRIGQQGAQVPMLPSEVPEVLEEGEEEHTSTNLPSSKTKESAVKKPAWSIYQKKEALQPKHAIISSEASKYEPRKEHTYNVSQPSIEMNESYLKKWNRDSYVATDLFKSINASKLFKTQQQPKDKH